MANWISGFCVKKHHEPLTLEILQKLHNAKERKLQDDTKKQEALEETKE